MIERFLLQNKVILLTGGTGLYGRGLSKDIAAAGARLMIASRNLASCEEVAASLRDEGLDVSAVRLDQGSELSITALRDRLKENSERSTDWSIILSPASCGVQIRLSGSGRSP